VLCTLKPLVGAANSCVGKTKSFGGAAETFSGFHQGLQRAAELQVNAAKAMPGAAKPYGAAAACLAGVYASLGNTARQFFAPV
jgi:hypothetical protein